MISESVFLFQDDPGVRIFASKGGRGLWPPRHDEKGNDGIENVTDWRESDHHKRKVLQVPLVGVSAPSRRGTRFEGLGFVIFAELE